MSHKPLNLPKHKPIQVRTLQKSLHEDLFQTNVKVASVQNIPDIVIYEPIESF